MQYTCGQLSLNCHFTETETWMLNKHMKRSSQYYSSPGKCKVSKMINDILYLLTWQKLICLTKFCVGEHISHVNY